MRTALLAWGRASSAPNLAQRVCGAAVASYHECEKNTLMNSTCLHKWWETLKGYISGVKPSIPVLRGPHPFCHTHFVLFETLVSQKLNWL